MSEHDGQTEARRLSQATRSTPSYRPLSDQSVPVDWVCLTGDDVTPVWNLQHPGTRNTWIRLEDAVGQWE
ncbi:MAG TPA: hypothetical protein VHF25_08320 [Nitriliruptorales bacterium]|nr:hypothetical protein [Nitriliruptorales bacterium]